MLLYWHALWKKNFLFPSTVCKLVKTSRSKNFSHKCNAYKYAYVLYTLCIFLLYWSDLHCGNGEKKVRRFECTNLLYVQLCTITFVSPPPLLFLLLSNTIWGGIAIYTVRAAVNLLPIFFFSKPFFLPPIPSLDTRQLHQALNFIWTFFLAIGPEMCRGFCQISFRGYVSIRKRVCRGNNCRSRHHATKTHSKDGRGLGWKKDPWKGGEQIYRKKLLT